MKTPSTELFDLIRALTKNEKGYFKKYSQLHVLGEKNNYALLFDAISKQKQYDEKKLLAKFKAHSFSKHFAVTKNYLYRQILTIMESYHHSLRSEIRSLLHQAEFLFEKKLPDQSNKFLKKAKIIAQKNEMPQIMLDIYMHYEMNVALQKSDMDWIKDILSEENEELNLLQNIKTYRDLHFGFALFYLKHGSVKNKKIFSALKKIISNPFFTDESKAKTFRAKLSFHTAHAYYAQITNKDPAIYRSCYKIVQLFLTNQEKIKQNVATYIYALNNLIDICRRTGKYSEIPAYLEYMEALRPMLILTYEKTRLWHILLCNRLYFFNLMGQYAAAVESLKGIEPQILMHENKLSGLEKAMLFSNIALSFFGAGEFKKCLLWMNNIREIREPLNYSDFEIFLRLFYLILLYETKNAEIMPYFIKSVYRFLLTKKKIGKFETYILDFLSKFSTRKEFKIHMAFKELRSELMPLINNSYEKQHFQFFDYISWLESKIENRPFAEVVRQKAGFLPDFI